MENVSPHSDRSPDSHSRWFESNDYVYPVLSRRACGLSIGINLNRDRRCNFHCVYCQVDHSAPASSADVDLVRLQSELEAMAARAASGELFETVFRSAPPALRRWNDFALSGDGEPTLCPKFEEAVAICADVRRRLTPPTVKIVLITNATLLDREPVRRGLAILDANHGEIWAKLDAGTETYYRAIDRSTVSFQKVLANLAETARTRPIVIQSLFLRMHGEGPTPGECKAYCDRLHDILAAGGQIKLVQLHTIARPPAESWVTPLSARDLDAIAELVRRRTGLKVATFSSQPAGA